MLIFLRDEMAKGLPGAIWLPTQSQRRCLREHRITERDVSARVGVDKPARSRVAQRVLELPAKKGFNRDEERIARMSADAVDYLCEAGMTAASGLISVALVKALRSSGFEARGKSGFVALADVSGDRRVATSHCWVEVLGKTLDLASSQMAFVEAAPQLGVSPKDLEGMRSAFGEECDLLFRRQSCEPIHVLGHRVPVGVEHGLKAGFLIAFCHAFHPLFGLGSLSCSCPLLPGAQLERKPITEKPPPESVPGAKESREAQKAYNELFSDDTLQEEYIRSLPQGSLEVFTAIAKLSPE